MENNDINCYIELSRADYLRNRAFLDNFEPIESDWKELFHWLMSKGEEACFYDSRSERLVGITCLWKDHIFTVLIDIILTKVEKIQDEFVLNMDLSNQKKATQDLKAVIEAWIQSIKRYLDMQLMSGENSDKNSAVLVAQFIEKQLKESLSPRANVAGGKETFDIEPEELCKMMNTIADIKEKGTSYLQQIEDSGSMDPGLALLLVLIRNYSIVVKRFNQRFSTFPELYHSKILMATPRKVVQDRTFLIIVPFDSDYGFYLLKGTQFIAGEKEDGTELLYETEKDEFISGMQLKSIFTIFQEVEYISGGSRKKIHKKIIDIRGKSPSLMFDKEKSTDYAYGWMIESSLLFLREGEATINIGFQLTDASSIILSNRNLLNAELVGAFDIYVSNAEGWSKKIHKLEYKKEIKQLVFTIEQHKINDAWVQASKEKHQVASDYPLIRLVASNENCPYEWAKLIEFDEVQINLEVQHARNVKVWNELGEIDSTKPFYPFGATAERGSWFIFGCEEITRKRLTEVKISGVWNRLPPLEKGYDDLYKYWYLDDNGKSVFQLFNDSFIIKCEEFVNGNWIEIEQSKTRTLFCLKYGCSHREENHGILQNKALIELNQLEKCGNIYISDPTIENVEINDNYQFRVILVAPKIGFGTEEFRQIFAARMIDKIKNPSWELPAMPMIPIWEDLQLSYKASDKMNLLNRKGMSGSIRLSRVTDLAEYAFNPIIEKGKQPFILKSDNEHILYLGILNALQKRTIRMYFDMVFLGAQMPQDESCQSDMPSTMEWHYINRGEWKLLEAKYILIDETCGFTQNGYIEFELPDRISEDFVDDAHVFWLKGYVIGDVANCLAIRSIYMDYIPVVAKNGDGSSIPAMTINQLKENNYCVREICQPFSGYGGRVTDSIERSFVHQMTRINSRNRALTPSDYEQLILEHFFDIGKVCCISPVNLSACSNNTILDVNIVVFTHTEDNDYPITPIWKLTEIKKYIREIISPFAEVKVINPVYQVVEIKCVATVRREVTKGGDTMKRMIANIWEYYASWKGTRTFPELGRRYSYKALHTIIANDKDIVKVFELEVNGKVLQNVDVNSEDICLYGDTPWNVIVPSDINLELLLLNGGIGHLKIEYNFVIQ